MISKLTPLLLALSFIFISSCASEPVIVHSNQSTNSAQNSKITKTPPSNKKTPEVQLSPTPTKSAQATLAQELKAEPKPEPKVDLKIVPKVQSPEILTKNLNNMSLVNDAIENKLTLNELEAAAADSTLNAFKPQLLLKIGNIYLKNKEPDRAAEYFRALTTLYPQSVYSTQASILLASLLGSSEADANVIGAILPLTGRNATVGQHALNAIRLGLGLNKNEKKFRIALFDSQSDAELAAKGVDKLVTEDKAIAILGGFTAKEATAIALKAELLSVPFIGFSQKTGLTNIGEYIFRNALTPEMQVDKLVTYATEKLKAKKFAILYPNDSYGVEFSNAFWDHVLARGGQITAAQTYDPTTTDFSESIQKMVGTYYEEARADELKQRLKEIKQANKKREKENKSKTPVTKNLRDSITDSNVLPPIVDFDVLFLPDSSKSLGQVLAFMKFNDVPNMNYLGTNLWNTSDLPKRTAGEDAGIYFSAGIDTNDMLVRDSDFFKNYLETYNEEPTIVEVQAYEAASVLKAQILSGATGRESLAASLRGLQSSQGVDGEVKMSSQREFIRPVHILTIESGLLKKIE